MTAITKARLEEFCVLYLNHQTRNRQVARVLVERPEFGTANWSLALVEPLLDLRDAKSSLAAVRELQSAFRMVV